MKTKLFDTVILSDLHLGSEISRASEAHELLQSLNFRRLILLGDIFCDLNFGRLNKAHWRFLSFIRELSNPKRQVEVIWVEGNHDYGLAEVMSHLVGIQVYKEYLWESGGKLHLAIHGHQFDSFIINNRLFMPSLVNRLYLLIQKHSPKGKFVARTLDKLNTRWQRLTPKVASGAIHYAQSRGASYVYCGHTHEPITLSQNGVFYSNSGAWTNSRPAYITIQGSEVITYEYIGGINNCYPCEERRETAA